MDIEEKRRRNREYMKARHQRRMQEDPEAVRKEKREWQAHAYAKNPEKYREAVKRSARKYPDRVKARYEAWLARNPRYHSDYTHRRIIFNYVGHMLYNCRRRAGQAGVAFDLALGDIVIPEVCPALGIPLVVGAGRGKGVFAPNSPSLDRVVPTIGYVKSNVRVISARANNLKNNGTPDELEKVAAYARRETERVLRENGQ
jgi:hypothetical protein